MAFWLNARSRAGLPRPRVAVVALVVLAVAGLNVARQALEPRPADVPVVSFAQMVSDLQATAPYALLPQDGETCTPPAEPPTREAWMSIIIGDPNGEDPLLARQYAEGVAVMFEGLKESGTTREMVLMTTDPVPATTYAQLRALGVHVVPTGKKLVSGDGGQWAKNGRFRYNLNKLHSFRLPTFRRMVFVDADHLVVGNMDTLFDDCADFCAISDPNIVARMGEGGGVGVHYFNSGTYSFAPSCEHWERLTTMMRDGTTERVTANEGHSEQDLLNYYFRDRVKIFPYKYNAQHITEYSPDGLGGLVSVHEKFWKDPRDHRWYWAITGAPGVITEGTGVYRKQLDRLVQRVGSSPRLLRGG